MTPITKARTEMRDIINRVVYNNERIVLSAFNKPVACIIPIEAMESLEAYEDAEDVRVAEERYLNREEEGTYSHEEIKRLLGVD